MHYLNIKDQSGKEKSFPSDIECKPVITYGTKCLVHTLFFQVRLMFLIFHYGLNLKQQIYTCLFFSFKF